MKLRAFLVAGIASVMASQIHAALTPAEEAEYQQLRREFGQTQLFNLAGPDFVILAFIAYIVAWITALANCAAKVTNGRLTWILIITLVPFGPIIYWLRNPASDGAAKPPAAPEPQPASAEQQPSIMRVQPLWGEQAPEPAAETRTLREPFRFTRRVVLMGGAVMLLLIVLFPPFIIAGGSRSVNAGYGFIGYPPPYPRTKMVASNYDERGQWHPSPVAREQTSLPASVNVGLLFAEIVGAGMMLALLYLAAPKDKP